MYILFPFFERKYLFFVISGGSWNEVQVILFLLTATSFTKQPKIFVLNMARLSLNPIGLHRFQPCLHLQPSQQFTLYPPRHRRIRFLTLASQTDSNHNEKDTTTSTTPVKNHFHYY